MTKFDPKLGRTNPLTERLHHLRVPEGVKVRPAEPGMIGEEELSTTNSLKARENLSLAAWELLRLRKMRRRYLPEEILGEPGWDAMLLLYAHDGIQQLTLTALAEAAEVASSTQARWVAFLEKAQLVESRPSMIDGRVRIIALTDKGRSIMDRYLVQMLRIS